MGAPSLVRRQSEGWSDDRAKRIFFFFLFRAESAAYGRFQVRDLIRAAAAILHPSIATPDPRLNQFAALLDP